MPYLLLEPGSRWSPRSKSEFQFEPICLPNLLYFYDVAGGVVEGHIIEAVEVVGEVGLHRYVSH